MPGSADSGRDHHEGSGSGRRSSEAGRSDGSSGGKSSSKSSPDCNSNLLAHSVIVPLPHPEGALNPPLMDFRHRLPLIHRPWADGEDPHLGHLPPPAHLGALEFLGPRADALSYMQFAQLEEAQRQAASMSNFMRFMNPMLHAELDMAATMRQMADKRAHNNGESTEPSVRDFMLRHPHITDARHRPRNPFHMDGYPATSSAQESHREKHREKHRERHKKKEDLSSYSRSESTSSSSSAGANSTTSISRQQSLASSNGSLSRQGSTASDTNDAADHKAKKSSESKASSRPRIGIDSLSTHTRTSAESETAVHAPGDKPLNLERVSSPEVDKEPGRPDSAKMESVSINFSKEGSAIDITSVSPPVTSSGVYKSTSVAVSSSDLHAPTVVSSPPPLTVISQSSSTTTATSSLSVTVPSSKILGGDMSISPTGGSLAIPSSSSSSHSNDSNSAENPTSKSSDIASSCSTYRWPMTKKERILGKASVYQRPVSEAEPAPPIVTVSKPVSGGKPLVSGGKPISIVAKPFAGGKPFAIGGKPFASGKPYASGKPLMGGKPFASGKPFSGGKPARHTKKARLLGQTRPTGIPYKIGGSNFTYQRQNLNLHAFAGYTREGFIPKSLLDRPRQKIRRCSRKYMYPTRIYSLRSRDKPEDEAPGEAESGTELVESMEMSPGDKEASSGVKSSPGEKSSSGTLTFKTVKSKDGLGIAPKFSVSPKHCASPKHVKFAKPRVRKEPKQKRGRGRPRKNASSEETDDKDSDDSKPVVNSDLGKSLDVPKIESATTDIVVKMGFANETLIIDGKELTEGSEAMTSLQVPHEPAASKVKEDAMKESKDFSVTDKSEVTPLKDSNDSMPKLECAVNAQSAVAEENKPLSALRQALLGEGPEMISSIQDASSSKAKMKEARIILERLPSRMTSHPGPGVSDQENMLLSDDSSISDASQGVHADKDHGSSKVDDGSKGSEEGESNPSSVSSHTLKSLLLSATLDQKKLPTDQPKEEPDAKHCNDEIQGGGSDAEKAIKRRKGLPRRRDNMSSDENDIQSDVKDTDHSDAGTFKGPQQIEMPCDLSISSQAKGISSATKSVTTSKTNPPCPITSSAVPVPGTSLGSPVAGQTSPATGQSSPGQMSSKVKKKKLGVNEVIQRLALSAAAQGVANKSPKLSLDDILGKPESVNEKGTFCPPKKEEQSPESLPSKKSLPETASVTCESSDNDNRKEPFREETLIDNTKKKKVPTATLR